MGSALEALCVVLEHCHARVLQSRPRGPTSNPGYGCSYERSDGYDHVYARVTQLLSRALQRNAVPASYYRVYDFSAMTFTSTRTCGRFVRREPAISDMDVVKHDVVPIAPWSVDRSRFCNAVNLHLAQPTIAANLHSLHLTNVPLHDKAATLLVLGLHACANLVTFVVDGAKPSDNAHRACAPSFLPERPLHTLRTFVACYPKLTLWRESYILRNARALTTLYLHKANLKGAWTTGAKLSDNLRVVHLHEVLADVSFWVALARTSALAVCWLDKCLDTLGPIDLFDELLPTWKATERPSLRFMAVEFNISCVRNAELRYHVGQHDRFLDGAVCEQLVSAFKPSFARGTLNLRLRMQSQYGFVMQNAFVSRDGPFAADRLPTSHAILDVLRRLHDANDAADEHALGLRV